MDEEVGAVDRHLGAGQEKTDDVQGSDRVGGQRCVGVVQQLLHGRVVGVEDQGGQPPTAAIGLPGRPPEDGTRGGLEVGDLGEHRVRLQRGGHRVDEAAAALDMGIRLGLGELGDVEAGHLDEASARQLLVDDLQELEFVGAAGIHDQGARVDGHVADGVIGVGVHDIAHGVALGRQEVLDRLVALSGVEGQVGSGGTGSGGTGNGGTGNSGDSSAEPDPGTDAAAQASGDVASTAHEHSRKVKLDG
ncbi:hypothetical protein BN13_1710002 [Nostocoides jenkinsii Ben 74]|uniref:Uncharacterized protein n=1 Tax=Nostocoides jenkinsii Ben 74 TaxID=1193518 RepID=A0A077M7D4_9MICO|nr:hypothetical protein BN13_1710002 [Tetrasphaera jenkinsii Ben 74]